MNFDFLKKYNWKEISDEWYGEPKQDIPKEIKKGSIEVEGKVYGTIKEASVELNIPYSTLFGWISKKRSPKIKCKKLK